MRLGSILDNSQAVSLGELHHRIHIYRKAIDMDHHDGLGTRGDRGRQLIGIHTPGHGIGIYKHRRCAGADDGGGTGNDRECGDNDFVSVPEL